jgi:hypothetical protein
MTRVPTSAAVLGALGLIPFLWHAATILSPGLADWGAAAFGPRFVGPFVGLAYGTVILAFMSGVLWGFATRVEGLGAAAGYALSTVPALWAFFFVGGGPVSAAVWLAAGFVLVLMLDLMFFQRGLAPAWWMRLRLPLTAVVVACLMAGVL